jgi:hypothetical protein
MEQVNFDKTGEQGCGDVGADKTLITVSASVTSQAHPKDSAALQHPADNSTGVQVNAQSTAGDIAASGVIRSTTASIENQMGQGAIGDRESDPPPNEMTGDCYPRRSEPLSEGGDALRSRSQSPLESSGTPETETSRNG